MFDDRHIQMSKARMNMVGVTISRQRQRSFQAGSRIANRGPCNGRAAFSSERKRARTQCVAALFSSNFVFPVKNNSTIYKCASRHHSSSSSAFRNPLHRNPSRISSSVGSIYKPPDYLLGIDDDPVMLPVDDQVVADSIRSCIKIDEHPSDPDSTRDMSLNTEMSICFLGTGAGSPANIRSTTCTLMKLSGKNYLFDVGEGTQRQLQFARGRGSSVQKIEKIFITHLHGDHIFGLPGLLLSLQTSCIQSDETARAALREKGRRRKTNATSIDEEYTVKIYGPPGLFNYIATTITLSCTRLHLLNVEVYEFVGGRVRRVSTPPPSAGRHLPRGSPRQQAYRDPFKDDYPEFRHSGGKIQRFTIPCEKGVWNIQDKPEPLTKEEIANSTVRQSSRGGTSHERIRIRAAEVDHMPGVATFGYVIEEDEPPRNLDVDKARALGVSHKHKKYELLKHGHAVQADDGRWVEPHEVLKATSKTARKIAIVGDNRGWTPQMAEIAKRADVLVHEATLLEEDRGRGHSTASQAGKNAVACNAQLLILNHISPKMESDMASVVREAYAAADKSLSVLMSFDFLEVLVPWMGFGNAKNDFDNDDSSTKDVDKS